MFKRCKTPCSDCSCVAPATLWGDMGAKPRSSHRRCPLRPVCFNLLQPASASQEHACDAQAGPACPAKPMAEAQAVVLECYRRALISSWSLGTVRSHPATTSSPATGAWGHQPRTSLYLPEIAGKTFRSGGDAVGRGWTSLQALSGGSPTSGPSESAPSSRARRASAMFSSQVWETDNAAIAHSLDLVV